jgi:hypothetical protein
MTATPVRLLMVFALLVTYIEVERYVDESAR